jgi:hypothetical protein
MDQIVTVAGTRTTEKVPSLGGKNNAQAQSGVSEKFSFSQLSEGPYQQYGIDSRYVNTTGLDVLPVGQIGVPGIVVRSQQPTSEKWVWWTCERLNAMPLLPALTTSDDNEVPISQEILFCNVLPCMGGGEVWRVSGVNKYKLRIAKTATSIYPVGTTPAENAPAVSRFYGPDNFSTTIIDASAGSPAKPSAGLTLQQVIQ